MAVGTGPGSGSSQRRFLTAARGPGARVPCGFTLTAVDLRSEEEDVAAAYSLFRRYLFEYRAELALPLMFLLDSDSRARKVYATIPDAASLKADLAQAAAPLPFAGKYYRQPRRNYFKLGAAFYWAGYPERALPYLTETLRATPDNWKALQAVGRIQAELSRNNEALASFRRLIEMKPDYAPAYVNAGEVYRRLNDAEAARRMFARALDLDAKCADAMNQLGVLAAENNDTAAARELFERAIAAQRDYADAIDNLGVLYAKTGQMNDAIAAFRYGIQAAPKDEKMYLNLARIYVGMGDREQARAVLNQLLETKPDSTVAARALAQLEGR